MRARWRVRQYEHESTTTSILTKIVVAVTAAIAGGMAAALYLDAKFHLLHDLTGATLATSTSTAQKFIAERETQGRLLLYHVIEEHALNRPDLIFLSFEDRSWTYGEFHRDLQKVGNWLMNDVGVAQGEMIALNGPNSAEYLLMWFALEAVGASISFINCNLTGKPLAHSIKLCGCRKVLVDRSICDLMSPCQAELADAGIVCGYYDNSLVGNLIDRSPIPPERTADVKASQVRGLIYTSGTTGLPKAVMSRVGRNLNNARQISKYLGLSEKDKFYTCLPLYHGAAQGLCTGPVIYAGASMRLGKKFSHKTFWNEVYESQATRLQYVGELCRYLVNAPPHPLERKHRLKEAWGNGMRQDVWEVFRQRFNIPVIHELYAATDGMGATFNRNQGDFSRNAVGVRGAIWQWQNGSSEVRAKIDPDTEEILRGDDGWVVKADGDAPGEVLHRVSPTMKETSFPGYFRDEASTEKRWMRNVFSQNDLWLRSGDMMRVDRDGRVFFVDRLGDTFRWKSENVSTNEVADTLGAFDQVAECSVYGVQVPHADGRCGCATIVTQPPTTPDTLDLAALAQHTVARLPRYAVPLFLRVAQNLSYTGTFKVQKGQAKREGVNLDLIKQSGSTDKIFWLPPGSLSYQPYSEGDWKNLQNALIKL